MQSSLVGPYNNIRAIMTVNFTSIGMTYNEMNQPETGTTGKRLSVTPGVEYSIFSDLIVVGTVEIPLWRDSNQSLYGNKKAFKIDLFWFIHNRNKNVTGIKTIEF